MQKSVLINKRHIVRKSFGRTVNKKCCFSETRNALRTKTAVHKGKYNNNNNNNKSLLTHSFPSHHQIHLAFYSSIVTY